ncbi:KTSC domain-containing protein [uncultured Enterovirga sp.]|uniref:KTSC domain-containing protein n=1 Tax=uncultured Enterovirga sp. TaxID=2026352 RepID=UPI0035CC07CD
MIAGVEYDGRETLVVTFVSGRRYAYAGVPPELYERLLAADSKGKFYNEHIRMLSFVELHAPPGLKPRSAA